MADNYLERKMEDLRRGTPSSSPKSLGGPRKGYVQFPFPPRKIMMAGIDPDLALSIIREFSKTGCKITFLHSDAEAGMRFAKDEGVRFCRLSNEDACALEKAFDETIKAWREIDVIICPPSIAAVLGGRWENHLNSIPIPRSYRSRMILLAGCNDNEALTSALNDIRFDSIYLNGIQISRGVRKAEENMPATKARPEDVARIVVFLSLPANDCIAGNIINLS
ncbi:MAG: hypothetical protein K2K81_03325 [Muribaculaceae bacterium]|nr:hypothetical protein [Muribaculaceae bacterium]